MASTQKSPGFDNTKDGKIVAALPRDQQTWRLPWRLSWRCASQSQEADKQQQTLQLLVPFALDQEDPASSEDTANTDSVEALFFAIPRGRASSTVGPEWAQVEHSFRFFGQFCWVEWVSEQAGWRLVGLEKFVGARCTPYRHRGRAEQHVGLQCGPSRRDQGQLRGAHSRAHHGADRRARKVFW